MSPVFSQVTIICATCGKSFMVPKCRANTARYCNPKCVKKVKKHGLCATRLYNIYKGLFQRCYNPGSQSYRYYGGRGITVCAEWHAGVVPFVEWARANGYADHLELDRINCDGPYSPDNCRWATRKEQTRNTRKKRADRSTSRFKGVYQPTGYKRWIARIRGHDGAAVHLGCFDSQEDAALAYDAAAKQIQGEFARLNFS